MSKAILCHVCSGKGVIYPTFHYVPGRPHHQSAEGPWECKACGGLGVSLSEDARAQQRRTVIEEFREAFVDRWNQMHDELHRDGVTCKASGSAIRHYWLDDEYQMFTDVLDEQFDEWTSADAGTEDES